MKKRFFSSFLFLVSLLLALQLVFPLVNASALTTNNTVLPPSNLSSQLITPSDVKLSWTSVYGATGYNVYGILDGQLKLLGTTTSSSYTFNNLPEGSYSYVVSTLSADGESGPCAPVSINITYPNMIAPINLTNKLQNVNDIVLSWTASQYAQTYNLYQIGTDGEKTLVTSTKLCTYTITNAAEANYTYAVSSVNSLYGESSLSTPTQVEITFPTMAAPSNLTSSLSNGNDITLKWNAVNYATSYKIYQIVGGEKILKSTITGTTVTYTNMPAGNYVYQVYSYSSRFGESLVGSETSLDLTLPTMQAPSNLTYTIANGNDITLKWGTAPYATGYKVYQIIGGEKVLKTTLTGTTVTYTNMSGGDYLYEVHSYSDRFGESTEGSQASFTLVLPTMQAPSNLTYTIANGNDITLKWGTVPYATGYKVYQIIGGEKVLKSTVTGTTVTYTNISSGDYIYEIHSYSDRFGESADGSNITFSFVAPVMQPPTNAVETIKSVSSFNLSWDASPYATSYKVYQIVDGQKVLKSTVATTSILYTGMTPGDYNFEIHSYSTRFGESADGSIISFTLTGQVMQAPTNLTYSITNGNDVTLKWTAVQYATSYKIYQVIDGQPVLKQTVTSTSVTFTNMPAGDYDYIVDSVSTLLGESQVGAETTFSLVLPTMSAPSNLTFSIQNTNNIVLTWSSVPYANNYKIYELIDGQLVLKTTVSSTTATLTNVSQGDHTYVVNSSSTRFGQSVDGNQVSVSIIFPTMLPPTNLTYSIANGNDITLKWTASANSTAYRIYQIIDGEKVLKKTVTGTSATFTNMPEGDYSYEIHSYNDIFGESSDGSQTAFTLVFPTMVGPSDLVYKIQNVNNVVLTWTADPYASSYKIYELIDGQLVLKTTVSSTTATLTNVSEGDHTYIVNSVSTRFGESQDGSQISVSIVLPTMLPPDNLTYSIANGNNITLKWNASANATAYKIYQIVDGQKILKQTVTDTSATFANMPEGDYSYEVDSYSTKFGESPIGSTINFTLVFPVMQAPANLTDIISNGNDITLNWTASTYANSYKIYQIIDGQKVLKQTVTGTSVTFANMPEGDYSYEVHSYSTKFGESPEGNQINFTLVFPVMQAPANLTDIIANGNDITLKWNASAYANSYKIYQIIDGQKILKQTVTTTSVTFTNLPAGDYSYEVHSYSTKFGESPIGGTIDFTLTLPVVQPPTLTATVSNINNITLSWKAVNWANEYRLYELKNGTLQLIYKGTALTYTAYNVSEDTHIYQVTAYSTRFGESALSNQITETIVYPVMQPPVVNLKVLGTTSIQLSWNFITYANGYNVYEIVDGVPVLLVKNLNNLSFTVNGLSHGNHQYYVTSFSNSFGESNPSNTVIAKLIVDTEPPVTSANAPANWTNESPITITLSATDNDTGVAKTFYSVDRYNYSQGTSFTVKGEGIHKIVFYSVDNAGNIESVNTIYVKIDKTAPVTTSTSSTDWSKDGIAINLTAADSLSGVAKTFYSIDGSDYLEGTSFTVQGGGVHKVSFYSVDNAGNIESANTIYVTSDNAAPVTTSNAPAGWSKDDCTGSLTAADSQSGVAETFYSIDGSDYLEGTSFTVQGEGIHSVSFYSVDNAGNVESINTVYVNIDKAAPVTTSNSSTDWSKDDVTVNLTSTDSQSGVAKTFYSIDGSDYLEGTSFTVQGEGIHSVSFYSVDNAGNVESINTVYVNIDKTAPVTASNSSTDWSKDDVTINLTATDSLSGVAKTFYSIDGSDYLEGTSFTVQGEGIHKVSFYSVDAAGNIESINTTYVKIDKTAPTITMDLNSEYKLGSTLQLNYIARDNLSGVVNEKALVFGPNETTGKVISNGTNIQFDKPGVYTIIVTVTDAAGLSTTIQKQVVVYIPANIEVTAKVIKGNTGVFTVRVDLPSGYSSQGFDLNTAKLNGVNALTSNNGYYNQAKIGQFKFERSDFNWTSPEVIVEFRCYVNGYLVIGQTTVKVQK